MAMHVPSGVPRPVLSRRYGVVMTSLPLAYAHGPAEWIQRGGFKNAAGELCCGERDCFELTDADVKITPAGYFVDQHQGDDPVRRGDAFADRHATGAATGAARASASSRLQAAPELRRA